MNECLNNEPNYITYYNSIQMCLPLGLGYEITPTDELLSFLEAIKGVDLSKYMVRKETRGRKGHNRIDLLRAGASINLVPVKQRKYLKKELKNIRKNTSLKHENRGVNMSENKVIDKQFKLDAVQYRKDHPELTFQQVADNLGVSNSSIHRWCKQFDDAKNENEDSNLFRGSGNFSSDEAKELARLKKENRDLKDAVEILKKAMSIISSQ